MKPIIYGRHGPASISFVREVGPKEQKPAARPCSHSSPLLSPMAALDRVSLTGEGVFGSGQAPVFNPGFSQSLAYIFHLSGDLNVLSPPNLKQNQTWLSKASKPCVREQLGTRKSGRIGKDRLKKKTKGDAHAPVFVVPPCRGALLVPGSRTGAPAVVLGEHDGGESAMLELFQLLPLTLRPGRVAGRVGPPPGRGRQQQSTCRYFGLCMYNNQQQ